MLTDQSRIKDISDMGKRILTLVDNLLQTVPQFFSQIYVDTKFLQYLQ